MTALTISIVSHGHGAMVDELLADLAATRGASKDHIVLTLNKEGESFDASRHDGLRLTVLRNAAPKGFGANHNAAFAHCRTPWFVVLNPDIRMAGGDPLAVLLERLASLKSSNVGVIAPRIVSPSGQAEDSVRPNLTFLSLFRRVVLRDRSVAEQNSVAQRPGRFFWLAGMFLVINAEAFKEIHGFDERFRLYCEDYDLSARLYLRGRLLIVDRSVSVVHDARRSSHRSLRYLAWHVTSLLRVWCSSAFWRIVWLQATRGTATI